MDTPMPDMSMAAAPPTPTIDLSPAPATGFWGFLSNIGGGFFFVLILALVIILFIIILVGRVLGVFKDAPQGQKENFEVMNSEPAPSCNTDEALAIFPAI